MKTFARKERPWILLTGATGFLGAALVHELITRNQRVLCLVRSDSPTTARERVVNVLRSWTSDVEHLFETGQLAVIRGDLHASAAGVPSDLQAGLRGRIASVVHVAGNVRFSATTDGEPAHTNVGGTEQVFKLAHALDCRDWHFVSTAYVAGAVKDAREQMYAAPPPFRNVYEQSKWEAEQRAATLARQAAATLTIYRPSIVVGHSETGQATRFTGVYYLFRATSLLARAAAQQKSIDRHALPLHIPARASGQPNLICSDDVAHAFGTLFADKAAHGGVYHVTHPEPPTNAQLKRVLEAEYDLAGGSFVGDAKADTDQSPPTQHAPLQQLFDEVTQPVADYLFDAPRFDRTQVDRFVKQPPAPWTDERLARLIAFAEHGGWRASGTARHAETQVEEVGKYFREFLPARMAGPHLAAIRDTDLSVRFEIGSVTGGHWWCRFANGRVVTVEPAANKPADVVYRTSVLRFRAAVAGEISGAELFLSGDAQVEGDIERALKFAMVLEEFVRAHPYAPPASTTNINADGTT